jgi:hypothetical protein
MVATMFLATVLGLVGVVIHRLLHSEQIGMRAAFTERTISRLATRFRNDVHAATTVVASQANGDQPTRLELAFAPNSPSRIPMTPESKVFQGIVYSVTATEVVRESLADGKVASREAYRLPDCRVSLVDSTANRSGAWVGLRILRQATTSTPQPRTERPWRPLQIDAEVGRIDRLTKSLLSDSKLPEHEDSR